MRRAPWLGLLFLASERGWRVEPRWDARRVGRARSFAEQYRELTRRAGSRVLVFRPVGRFVEFRGRQRILAELKPEPYRPGTERLSEEIDPVVYGRS